MGTGLLVPETALVPEEIASLTLPSPFGEWETHAFEWEGSVHLCLCRGTIGDGEDVLVRMHSGKNVVVHVPDSRLARAPVIEHKVRSVIMIKIIG